MRIVDLLSLFVKIDDQIKDLTPEEIKKHLGLKRLKKMEFKMAPSEYITLILVYRFSSLQHLKAFWYKYKFEEKNSFPNMPSYNTFVSWINRLNGLLEYILNKNLKQLTSELGIIDSTKLETTKPYRFGKIHRKATAGYSSLGIFRGFKLHLVIDRKGLVCAYEITPANIHDLTVVKKGLLDNQTGKILADSGYVSRDVYYKLMDKNIYFIAKPKANMMLDNSYGLGYLPKWETLEKVYKLRMIIERLFDYFKDKLNMVLNKLHSTKALFTHVTSVLLANQLMKLNQIKFDLV